MKRHSKKKSPLASLLSLILDMFGICIILLFRFALWLIRVIPRLCHFVWSIWGYGKSEYAKVTHRPLLQLIFDKGAYGEYLIYRHLDKILEGERKWLFNAYLPRSKSRTTEIDVMLFHASGIYVFESKNYKGWIFGTETHRVWMQCIKPSEHSRARKYRFLNPIMQNKLHLSAFSALLNDEQKNVPVHSVILFGNRCNLKKIDLTSGHHTVIRLKSLTKTVQSIMQSTPAADPSALRSIYDLLYPMTQVSDEIKQKHIADIEAELATEKAVAEIPADPAPVQADQPIPVQETSVEIAPENAPAADKAPAAEDITEQICPRCGGTLITRTVTKGERAGQTFIGCSNFPKCRYTK